MEFIKILIIVTSHQFMGESGKPTGVWLEELTTPYYAFVDAGYQVEVVSLEGGEIPIDPRSLGERGEGAPSVERYLEDGKLMAIMGDTPSLAELGDTSGYSAVFLPGGHGTMWDMPEDKTLAQVVSQTFKEGRLVAAVCHGPAGLLSAVDGEGKAIVHGRKVAAFTNAEEEAVGLTKEVPFLLETRLRELGADVQLAPNFESFAVQDGNLITGQNPASSGEVARLVIAGLKNSEAQRNEEAPLGPKKHLLIAGSSGAVGGGVKERFAQLDQWNFSTLTRSGDEAEGAQHVIAADLLKEGSLEKHQEALSSVTHLFYAVLKPNADPRVEADENAQMLTALLDALAEAEAPLEHVIFVQGGKVYGAHLGVYRTPAREDDSRHFPPNLYFNHEDIINRRAKEDGFLATALRPDIIIGNSMGSSMNLGNLIGVYGTLCREMGVAMQFPGTAEAYEVLVNVTNSEVLAEAVQWAAEGRQEGAYNITNGDVFRWKHVWPQICEFFGLAEGEPQPISLQERLSVQNDIWQQVVESYGLEQHAVLDYSQGSFGDFIFHVEDDAIFDVTKARQHGFQGMSVHSDESIIAHLQRMQELKLIPDFGSGQSVPAEGDDE